MTDHNSFEALFQSYNDAIREKCEEYMESATTPGDYESIINEARKGWEEKLFKGKKPGEYFERLQGDTDLNDVFTIGCDICDEFIPESLAEKAVGQDGIAMTERHAFGAEGYVTRNVALKIIGKTGNPEYAGRLMDIFSIEDEYGDLIKETARKALTTIGKSVVPLIIKRLSEKDLLNDDDFHMIMALVEIDAGGKSDEILKVLKESFRKTHDKALAARCLSDFGDGRAVPMLRSYLEKNADRLDNDAALEIQGAVMNLGGSVDGIDLPYR
ncbi:MAG: hypothetical protein JXB33_05000 [Clostridia bacterium]|nr:hypothetical protein [Clostridia bacterium]